MKENKSIRDIRKEDPNTDEIRQGIKLLFELEPTKKIRLSKT